MKPTVSILISSHNRSGLFRRCLWSIAYRPPTVPFEVVVADDGSDEDILGLLKEFSPCFPWKFIRVNVAEFEQATGVKRFFNNPSLTNNIAFRQSSGDFVYLMGNEIIAYGNAFTRMLEEIQAPTMANKSSLVFSTTYDLQQQWLDRLDTYGSNLTPFLLEQASRTPLQSSTYPSDVTNYLSLCPRSLWQAIGGYDERYLGGISSDDSDFVRRARALGAKTSISEAVTLHQYHQGKTCYYDPPASVITAARWKEGVDHNHAIYHAWDGQAINPQPWPWGTFGIVDIVDNTKVPKTPAVLSATERGPECSHS